MSQLVVASNNPALSCPLRAHVAHDLRNLLATVGLHLDTLQRLSGPSGAKAANAANALLTRGVALCNDALDRTAGADSRARRRGVDMIGIAREVADLLAPAAPKDLSFDIRQSCSASVLADPNETFRILFNLMSNAVAVANRKPASLTSVTLHVMASWARAASSLCVSSKRPSSSRSCAPFSGKSGRMERTALGTARQLVPQPPSTARATSTRGRYLPLSGVRPCSWTGSRDGFDPLPGVVILELRGTQVAERGVQPAGVVSMKRGRSAVTSSNVS